MLKGYCNDENIMYCEIEHLIFTKILLFISSIKQRYLYSTSCLMQFEKIENSVVLHKYKIHCAIMPDE